MSCAPHGWHWQAEGEEGYHELLIMTAEGVSGSALRLPRWGVGVSLPREGCERC
jgi:hypothetical protein